MIRIRFDIEANYNVTKEDIFISLVHFLEQTVKKTTKTNNYLATTSVANAFSNENLVVIHVISNSWSLKF